MSCARKRVKLRKNTKTMTLFPSNGPLEFVCLEFLGPHLRISRVNQFQLVIIDPYLKLTRMLSVNLITSGFIPMGFYRYSVSTYGKPVQGLVDNGKKLSSKFFMHCCRIIGVLNVFTTTCHPQINGPTERFNRTILSAVRHYTSENPTH